MNRQKFSGMKETFLQRRYGVRLGRRYVLTAASVVLLGVLGCSQVNGDKSALAQSPAPNSESVLPKKTANPDTKLVKANNKFGFKLFSEVLKNESSDKNIFLSPSSVAIALAMTYNGASGSTQQAMAKTLELQGMNLAEINSAYSDLKQLLENPNSDVRLNIANSLWANKNAKFQSDFIQKNKDYYKAQVTNLDFQDASAPNIINNWVKDNTQGKINKIVDNIDPNQMLFLINAIYFKGKWSNEFDKSQTATLPFNLASGQQKNHPMMSQDGDYRYQENAQFQAVSLPYGKDGKFSLYIFLPKQNSSLKSFYQTLNAENWEQWMTQFRKREGSIRLPRFKTDYEVTLNDALKALGMGEAFSNKANFSGIGKNLTISQVKHKTFVEVNEEGTEAAASTSVSIVATSAVQKPEPFKMIVDRPFFCAIRDNQTGSVLFMGSIMEPQ
ncbi:MULTISPECIES: serpin family protein [Calothrix]|uniref:Serpin family protein n=2 Tax=Calothrix TaxID=1186 RepID=A0ABR8AKG6_9CYAN|nr:MULTISPECIES: serpin family protein [Calothrix]MBD2199181.1 serpin family protein [Calothrix parietina FACHB-288]MBD2227883.1 serpin family protein [Calothrix anomala FACHB-343]